MTPSSRGQGQGQSQQRRARLRSIKESLKGASILLELRDARVPHLSAVDGLLGNTAKKIQGIVLSKIDLAEPRHTKAWQNHLLEEGKETLCLDLTKQGRARKHLNSLLKKLGQKHRSALGVARVAIVGLPNVGKSSLINVLLRRKKTPTGDRPGVTKGKLWLRVSPEVFLLDTPGVISLFSSMEKDMGASFFKLVMCNIVPAGQYDDLEVLGEFLDYIVEDRRAWPFDSYYPHIFTSLWSDGTVDSVLSEYAKERGFLTRRGTPDLNGAARAVLADFRRGKIGRLTLDTEPSQGVNPIEQR